MSVKPHKNPFYYGALLFGIWASILPRGMSVIATISMGVMIVTGVALGFLSAWVERESLKPVKKFLTEPARERSRFDEEP
jgi:hypothetical protein